MALLGGALMSSVTSVTNRYMSRFVTGHPSVTSVTHPYRGVTVVTVTHERIPFSAINMAELVPMPPFGKAQGLGGLGVPFSLPKSRGAENDI